MDTCGEAGRSSGCAEGWCSSRSLGCEDPRERFAIGRLRKPRADDSAWMTARAPEAVEVALYLSALSPELVAELRRAWQRLIDGSTEATSPLADR